MIASPASQSGRSSSEYATAPRYITFAPTGTPGQRERAWAAVCSKNEAYRAQSPGSRLSTPSTSLPMERDASCNPGASEAM